MDQTEKLGLPQSLPRQHRHGVLATFAPWFCRSFAWPFPYQDQHRNSFHCSHAKICFITIQPVTDPQQGFHQVLHEGDKAFVACEWLAASVNAYQVVKCCTSLPGNAVRARTLQREFAAELGRYPSGRIQYAEGKFWRYSELQYLEPWHVHLTACLEEQVHIQQCMGQCNDSSIAQPPILMLDISMYVRDHDRDNNIRNRLLMHVRQICPAMCKLYVSSSASSACFVRVSVKKGKRCEKAAATDRVQGRSIGRLQPTRSAASSKCSCSTKQREVQSSITDFATSSLSFRMVSQRTAIWTIYSYATTLTPISLHLVALQIIVIIASVSTFLCIFLGANTQEFFNAAAVASPILSGRVAWILSTIALNISSVVWSLMSGPSEIAKGSQMYHKYSRELILWRHRILADGYSRAQSAKT